MRNFLPRRRRKTVAKGPRKLREIAPPMGERGFSGDAWRQPQGGRKGFQISIYLTRRQRRPLEWSPNPRNGSDERRRQKANMASENSRCSRRRRRRAGLFCQTDQRGGGGRRRRRRRRGRRKWKGEEAEEEKECSIIDKRMIRKRKSKKSGTSSVQAEWACGEGGDDRRFLRGWNSATGTRGASFDGDSHLQFCTTDGVKYYRWIPRSI